MFAKQVPHERFRCSRLLEILCHTSVSRVLVEQTRIAASNVQSDVLSRLETLQQAVTKMGLARRHQLLIVKALMVLHSLCIKDWSSDANPIVSQDGQPDLLIETPTGELANQCVGS